ncbi:MAG TPA: ABC transporter substrate-binding protein [Candidatus Limnocylindrales bacterium]|jgi:NitT/TauT family transport system substrate-binding protein|nr:ABC transporter substrate-binding protein [Candidatus Limnocylindrales bacterium]
MRYFFAVLLLAVMIAPAAAQSLKAGYISKDLNYLPFFIALKKGFYAKEGIPVDLVSIGRSDIQLQALVAGELHFANINADNIIIWNERTNGNLKVAAGSSNAAPYQLIGAKHIKRIEDLKGQRLGVNSLSGGATSILLSYLKSKGLIHPRDFSMSVIAGGTPARLSALESGAVAGAVLVMPFSDIAIDKGFPKLGDTTEIISNYQFNNININPAWAEKNRAAVVKFIRAHIQALHWIFEHQADTVEFLNKEFGLPTQYARRGIEYYTKNKVYPINGDVTLSGLKVNIEVQAQDGIIKGALPPPEKYIDLSYLRQAQKELGL